MGNQKKPPLKRVAVIAAKRTPFVKSFGVFEKVTPLELSLAVAKEVLATSGIDVSDLDEVIWGAVIPQTKNPNIARDVILFGGFPKKIPGYTLNRACASSIQTIQSAADAIQLGRCQAVLAGGVEVLSDVPITYSDEAKRYLLKFSKAKKISEKIQLAAQFPLSAFLPKSPPLAEPFTGLTMGEHGEIMAVKNKITRLRQDEFALNSHKKASIAIASGFLSQEIVPIYAGDEKLYCIEKDNIVRPETTLEQLSLLKPSFDRRNGTLTAGNSSALTDGASCALLVSEDYAKENNLTVLGYIVDSVTVAVDPNEQLLIGPAYAIPKLLERNKIELKDVGVFEIHEAFAAQVLSCLDSLSNEGFCKQKLNLKKTFGQIDPNIINVDGSSLAYGHPFAATGIRLLSRGLHVMKRMNSQYGVLAVCAAGGMGQAMLIEKEG